MDRRVFLLGLFAVFGLLLSVGGCINLGKNAPPTKFYMLSATNQPEGRTGEGVRPASAFVGVGPIKTPSYLDRPQIVTRETGYEMHVADFANWAEPLKDSFGRVLAEDLAEELGTDKVVVFPWTSEVPVDYQVQLDVIRFDGTLGQKAVLNVRWMIYGKPRKGLVANKHSLIQADTQGQGYGDLVRAMSETIQKLSSEIAGEIARLQ